MSSLNTVDGRLKQMLCVQIELNLKFILKEKKTNEDTELACKCVCVSLQSSLRNILINFEWDPNQNIQNRC